MVIEDQINYIKDLWTPLTKINDNQFDNHFLEKYDLRNVKWIKR